MKTLLLKTAVLFFCICGAIASTFAAKDLYISATGNDDNDGRTEAAPVKTLGRIHQIIGLGDILHVSGIIDVSLETKGTAVGTNYQQGLNKDLNGGFLFGADAWNNIKMVGSDPEKDGFTSKGDGRIFRIDGGNHTFENLLFTEGADIANDGGCGIWLRGSATITNTFINCRFVENKAKLDEAGSAFTGTNGRGGAVHIMNSHVVFKNCYFADNANTQGSAIFWHGGIIDILGCIFENHSLSTVSGTTGGALYSWAEQAQEPVVTIDRCIFRNNDVAGDGGAITLNNRNDRENIKLVLNITNCAFIGNEAFNNGGAIHHNNTRLGTNDTILIANTTFLGNTAKNFGGAIFLGQAQPNSIFTMVNSSVISNYTRGNGGHGAGLTIYQTNTSNMLKRIYNCIFDKNFSITQQIYSDFNYRLDNRDTPGENSSGEKEFIIKNTYVSTTLQGNSVLGTWFTNDNYPDNSINYTSEISSGDDGWIVDYVNASGIDDDPEFYLQQSDFPAYAIPLKDDAPARTFGNAAYLTQFGIAATDQLGKERVIEGNACAVGASEATPDEIEEEAFADYPLIVTTGIKKISDGKPASEFTVAGNIISMANKELQNAGLTLYNLTGSIVRTGKEQLSIADLPGGLYIVSAKVAGRNLVQKILK